MRHDRHSRKHNNGNWKNGRHDYDGQKNSKSVFRPTIKAVPEEQIRETEEAIRRFKSERQCVCPLCGEPVRDLSTAFRDENSESPVHFDCAADVVLKKNPVSAGEKIVYIGQGRFGVVFYPNVHDVKHFQIRKIIEWEEKDKKPEWRGEMSEIYSKVR